MSRNKTPEYFSCVTNFSSNSDEGESEVENESEEEEEASSQDVSSSDSDVEESMTTRPYSALLQSLAVDLAPQAKRRKLETTTQSGVVETREGDPLVATPEDDVDEVQEAEEGPETAIEVLSEEEDYDTEDSSDPFEAHFADPDDNILSKRLKALQKNMWTTQKLSVPGIGKAITSIPDDIQVKDVTMPAAIPGPSCLMLKPKLAGSFVKQNPIFDSLEQAISPCLFDYHDLLFCERTPVNSDRLRRLACLHAINHVFKYIYVSK